MTVYTEGTHAAEFILSEANGNRSRDNGTLASGQNLTAGTVVQWNADNKLVVFDGTRDSGGGLDPQAAGILIYDGDASDGDLEVAYLARDCEVNVNLITFPALHQDDTVASLKTIGIVAR